MFFIPILLKILVISDVHIDPEYVPEVEKGSESELMFYCRKFKPATTDIDQASLPTYPYGQYGCDLPVRSFKEMMSNISYENVSEVLMLGDIASHYPSQKAHFEESYAAYGRSTKARTIYVMGNNDPWMKTLGPTFTDDNEAENPALSYINQLLDQNGIVKLSPQQRATFLRGGYYEDRLEDAPFFSVNSVIYTKTFLKDYTNVSVDPRGQLEFLRQRVTQLKESNTTYYMGMHACPGIDLEKQKVIIEKEFSKQLFDIVSIHKPAAIFCGHTHRDQMRALADIPVFNSPGISPNTMSNPAYRIVELGKNGIVDYVQYFASVQNANYVGKIGFRFHYRFSELYGGQPNAATIVNVQKRMQQDPRLYAVFFEAEDTFYQDRRQNYLCATRTLGQAAYDQCMDIWGYKQGPMK